MATFDFGRLRKSQYDLTDAFDSIRFQDMVEEFMHQVRTNPTFLVGKKTELDLFVDMVDDKDGWPLAVNMVPEFQLTQNHDVTRPTALNQILRLVIHRRPAAPPIDPTDSLERDMLKKRIREAIEYIETEGKGQAFASEEQRRTTEDLVERADRLLYPLPDPQQQS